MKKRDFDGKIRALSTRSGTVTRLDLEKVKALPDEEKAALVTHLASQPVRKAGIVTALIPNGFDRAWLASMGFLYLVRHEGYELLCTAEHSLR